MMSTRKALAVLVFLAVAVSPALAEDTIVRGVDTWKTVSGITYSSFAKDPIPADFFCAGSPVYTGKVAMRGVPLVTEPAGVLGAADTMIRRLDDASFDENGVARTRIRVLALSMASIEPIDTGCGLFDVAVALAGEQRTTEMEIVRVNENGGTYAAPLAIDFKLTFTPVGGGEPIELLRQIDLGPGRNAPWASLGMVGTVDGQRVKVDTDGDAVADYLLPARRSGFHAGVVPAATGTETQQQIVQQPRCLPVCHCTPWSQNPEPNEPSDLCEHLHCTEYNVSTGGPCEIIETEL